jgi:hypothetical protein
VVLIGYIVVDGSGARWVDVDVLLQHASGKVIVRSPEADRKRSDRYRMYISRWQSRKRRCLGSHVMIEAETRQRGKNAWMWRRRDTSNEGEYEAWSIWTRNLHFLGCGKSFSHTLRLAFSPPNVRESSTSLRFTAAVIDQII